MTVIFVGTPIVSNSIIYSRRDLYRTVPIAKEQAPYQKVFSRRLETTGSLGFITPAYNAGMNFVQDMLSPGNRTRIFHTNRSYDRLKSKIGETSSIGATIAEAHSVSTVTGARDYLKRSGTNGFRAIGRARDRIITTSARFITAINYLRKGNLLRFTNTLRVRLRPNDPAVFKATDRAIASYWLAYWFGISPLIQDFYSSVDILTKPLPRGRIFGSSSETGQYTQQPLYYWVQELRWQLKVRQGCTFQIYNPNEFLRNQLGLANWWSIGLEVIPFSFFGDWVSNLSQVVSALSDFDGVVVTQSFTSTTCQCVSMDTLASPADPTQARFTSVRTVRSVGLSGPVLLMRLPERLSLSRAATAVSLLLVLFT